MAELILLLSDAAPRHFPVSNPRLRIGREADCDVRVTHRTVSRRHAELVSVGRGAFLRDLGSCNGTFVNGRMVRQSRLRDGDVVHLGRHELRYVGNESPGNPDPVSKTPAAKPSAPAALSPPGRLRVLNGPLQGQILSLKDRLTAIGRADSPIVAIARGGRRCFVMRVGGWDRCEHVAVNGRTVGSRGRALHDGDVLEVGQVRFAFVAAEGADGR